MSPTTLYREGTDLDELLAELDSRYPGQVRVVDVTHPREGGVLGFFAKQRVGVHYRLADEHDAAAVAGSAGPVRSKLLRDGFGPDPAAIRAALAQRAAADAPVPAPPDAGQPPAAAKDVGSGPLSDEFAGSAPSAARAAAPSVPAPGLRFEQLLADIALKKAASGAAPVDATFRPHRAAARPDSVEWSAAGGAGIRAGEIPLAVDRSGAGPTPSAAGFPPAPAYSAAANASAPAYSAAAFPPAPEPVSAAASFAAIDFAELASFTATAFGGNATGISGAPAAGRAATGTLSAGSAPEARRESAPIPVQIPATVTPTITLRRRSERAVPQTGVQAPASPRPGTLSWPLAAARTAGTTALLERPAAANGVAAAPTSETTTLAPATEHTDGDAVVETTEAAPATGNTAADAVVETTEAPVETTAADAAAEKTFAEPASMRAASYPIDDGSVTTSHTTPFTLRRKLLEVGVPVDRVPTTAVHSYAAVEQLARGLAPAPALPVRPGQILVLAGPARDVAATVDGVLAGNPGVFESIWAYACPAVLGTRWAAEAARAIASPEQAAEAAQSARADTDGPTLVAVATDSALADGALGVLAALDADAVWAAVDATRKPADTRRALRALPAPDAIAVANADISASPATVWELDLPIALVDGRPSSGPSWAVLLLGKLAELEETECSDAPC